MMATETMTTSVLSNESGSGGGANSGGASRARRWSFKTARGGAVASSANGNVKSAMNGYNAVRVVVAPRVVSALASRFNAVVVDANPGATSRDIVHKVNKTLAAGVRASIEKFEPTEKKPKMVVVRTNSDQKPADELSVVRQRMKQFQNTAARPEPDAKPGPKPTILTPKPVVSAGAPKRDGRRLQKDTLDMRLSLSKQQKRLSIARDPDAKLESVLNAVALPPEPESPRSETRLQSPPETSPRPPSSEKSLLETKYQWSPDTRLQRSTGSGPQTFLKTPKSPSFLKTRSKFSPETEPRSAPEPKIRPEPKIQPVAETKVSLPVPETQCEPVQLSAPEKGEVRAKPNKSFLLDRIKMQKLQQQQQKQQSQTEETDSPAVDAVQQTPNRSSFLHEYKKKLDDQYRRNNGDYANESHQAIYEELCDIQVAKAKLQNVNPLPDVVLESSYYDNANDYHYATIGSDGHNIYDDVNPAAAAAAAAAESDANKRSRPADDKNGGIVDDLDYETVEAPVVPVIAAPLPTDGRPAAKAPPSFVGSVEIDNSIYGLNPPSESTTTSSGITSDSASAGHNSKFEDEEWVDMDNTSDELQEIIVFNPKPKINDTIPNGWSLQVQKQLSKANVSISSQSVISFIKDVPEQVEYKKNPCDVLSEQLLSVVLKTVFLEEQFELQELSLYFDNDIKDKANTTSQNIPEDIYVEYDSFESDDSWDDYKDDDKYKYESLPVPYPCKNRDLPEPPNQQSTYGFLPLVKKAKRRMKTRWSLGSLGLNKIMKLNARNSTTDLDNKTYGSVSETSIKKKHSLPALNFNKSSSVFYTGNDGADNKENSRIYVPVKEQPQPPSSLSSRSLCLVRPSSPPPPPPPLPVKRHSTGNYVNDPQPTCNFKGMLKSLPENKNYVESVSENDSNLASDLYMRFADEPFYQFYAASLSERSKIDFADTKIEECEEVFEGYEEIISNTSRPSALELITPCTSGHGQHRSLWCEVPEVKNSGILDTLKPSERKLQEAKFELITSEASYFKSLTVLEKHFVESHSLNDETILNKKCRQILFENVKPVRKCSEKLLAALEKCWQNDILLKGLCEILYTHSKENFDIFIKYCSNQIYIDRTMKSLKEKNVKLSEALHRLESDPQCQSLSLHSFLMLPMQRITRLPLLVDAMLTKMNPVDYSTEYHMCEMTLASLNAIVQNCNESTRKLERYEEMLVLSQQLEFSSKKDMKSMSVASSSRWLVRSGSMICLTGLDAKLTLSRKLLRPTKLYFFLFNDMFFIAKRKSEENYVVVDYCARNFVQMDDTTVPTDLVINSSYKNLLMLTILENYEAKTVEMLLSCDSDSSKKRWIEAMSPPISSNPDETLYNEWDCPQVLTEHDYTAVQPDELSLQRGDTVKVLTKMNDGWYHGERIRDGMKGWFPANYTSEIASQHARAKNLKQRYRFLAMSGSYLQSKQDKIKKK